MGMVRPKMGLAALFSAGAMYGMYGIYSRMIGGAFGNFNQNWLRNIAVALVALLIISIGKIKLKPVYKKDIKWITLWFLSSSWATVLTFIAFNHLKVGTVYLLVYSAMITSGYLSGKIFFEEKINVIKIVSLFLALGGLLVIYRFSITKEEVPYMMMCLVSGLMTGVWNTISKKFSGNYSNMQLVLMDATAIIVTSLIGAIISQEILPQVISPTSWGWLVVYALAQLTNVGLVVYGFKNVEAQIGSLILPVEIIFATLFAWLFFGENPTVSIGVGGIMILGAAAWPSMYLMAEKTKRPVG